MEKIFRPREKMATKVKQSAALRKKTFRWELNNSRKRYGASFSFSGAPQSFAIFSPAGGFWYFWTLKSTM